MSEKSCIGDRINTRNLIGTTLCELAGINTDIWALTPDSGLSLKPFIQSYPDRYIDTGIAEQNTAGIAAGLALCGAIPFIVGMAPFVTMRAFEQNRTLFGYHNIPVRIIGYCAGMTTQGGSTHYAMEDISIMRSIANMSVVSISDPFLMPSVIRKCIEHEGPVYIRLGNGRSDPVIYNPDTEHFSFGKGIVARDGKDIAIISHGVMTILAISLADKLKSEGISVRVVDMCSIKPIDADLIELCANENRHIIVWEDHYTSGGLCSAVADVIVDRRLNPDSFSRVGIPELYPGFGADIELYNKFGMDDNGVEELIRKLLG